MFDWLKKKPRHVVISVKELEQVRDVLFPQFKLERLPNGEAFHIDQSVDTNLEAILCDLEEGINNEAVQKSLRSIVKKLFLVRDILGPMQHIHPEVSHIVFAQEPEDQEYAYK